MKFVTFWDAIQKMQSLKLGNVTGDGNGYVNLAEIELSLCFGSATVCAFINQFSTVLEVGSK